MKYVALLSGGKDSCFNLLHCARNGHELVATASLGPGLGKGLANELDSYMYQTVGQDAIEYVARALDIPLVRRVIHGTAVQQSIEYGSRSGHTSGGIPGDETEDLYELLSTVKLVQYYELLDEMIASGQESILIKVAGIGLTATHLGKTLAEMRSTLFRLVRPNNSFSRHLVETESVVHSDNDFAPVAYLRLKKAVLEPKGDFIPIEVNMPLPLSSKFDQMTQALRHIPSRPTFPSQESMIVDNTPWLCTARQVNGWLVVGNVSSRHLAQHSLQLSHCSNINLFLSSMDLFARVNAIYARYFGTSPPARATVAVDLPASHRVRMDCIAKADSVTPRHALHVQGLSYWAPANIGPYSQAIVEDERIFISGQIGLFPPSLTLPEPPSIDLETALSFQHADRIVDALKSNTGGHWRDHMQLAVQWLTNADDIPKVQKACEMYSEMSGGVSTPTLFAVVKGLPKHAFVERQLFMHTGRFTVVDEDGEPSVEQATPVVRQGDRLFFSETRLNWN
ncbi:adenine nucleotide alpha hydrolases-like protein [Fistulina hepatica ATCC 64428]|nr:adenine nucleotide alpha hydrolases-like protein [Fistulina hepatica ATCC 64428]